MIDLDAPTERAVSAVDQMLKLTTEAKRHRDPVGWLENALLDMRLGLLPRA